MTRVRSAAIVGVSFVALTACDRFRHAKYERSPWGASAGTTAPIGSAKGDRPAGSGGGSVVVVGTGGALGGGDAGGGGCGLTFEEASCDTCMKTSCCAAESACAADSACSGIGDCITACGSSDSCIDKCESAYESNTAARQLDACLASWCASACD